MNEQLLYPGDGVHVGHDGFHVWLWTSDGRHKTNQIALDPEVLANLLDWVKANTERKAEA